MPLKGGQFMQPQTVDNLKEILAPITNKNPALVEQILN